MTNPNEFIYPSTVRAVVYQQSRMHPDGSISKQDVYGDVPTGGLTKREYFAGLLMSAYVANPTIAESIFGTPNEQVEKAATIGVRLADALIAELSKSQGKEEK